MRGLSAVFGPKPSDKSLAGPDSSINGNDFQPRSSLHNSKKPSRIFGTLSRKTNARLVGAKDPALSSSSSSSGTNSLRTPGDDEALGRNNNKVPWLPWLGRKKSGIVKKPDVHQEQWQPPQSHHPPLVLRPLPQPADETDDESSSDSEDESEGASASADLPTVTITPLTLAKCRANLRALIANSLQPPFSPPPVLHVPGQPIFPRSCNPRRSLYKQETLETRMHRNQILRRLDRQRLTRTQELSISSFGMLPTLTIKRPSLQLDDEAVSDSFQIRTYSQGLQRWALRPCFEDRVAVYTAEPGTGNVLCTRVAGPSFGVAALEISEALDVLAGAIVEESDLESPSINNNSSLHIPAAPHQGRNAPSLPSPLRMEHGPPIPSIHFPSADSRTMPAVPTVKRGVRFAEDDKEDQIPLGYILRIKKKREEKAKFIQEEKERRAFEEERARQEEERLRREIERQEWEKEKKTWEREKRTMEEERRQRQYAEEVAAARIRRDAARSGFYVGPSSQDTSPPHSREVKSSTRSMLDVPRVPRRQSSEPAATTGTLGSPYNASPASSNPPSANGGSPAASGYFSSRPPSINSANTTLSSAEDLQPHRKNTSKRSSLGSDQPFKQEGDRTSQLFYPVWSPGYLIPPIAHMPAYPMNMPLLPPTPPFMMEQNHRSPSSNSRSHNRSSSPHRLSTGSANNSTERLPSSQRSATSSQRPERQHHRRNSSDDILKDSQRPPLSDRRPISAADIHHRSSTQRSHQSSHPPVASRSHSLWATSTPPHDSHDRTNRRQSVIT